MYDKVLNMNLNEIIKEKTELCDIMTEKGSDKGRGHHNYTRVYNYLFNDLKDVEINLLEVGIGSINPKIPANMGIDGVPGASLKGWKRYFNKASIIGADVDQDILFEEDRIKTYYLDQTSEISVKLFHKEINTKFDIIIDDGYNVFSANYNMLIYSIDSLKENGIYIIEDIDNRNINNYTPELLLNIKNRFNLRLVQLFNIPHEDNVYDNRLLILVK
jgi:hypothetical protein